MFGVLCKLDITAKKAWYDHLISLVTQINFFGAKSVCALLRAWWFTAGKNMPCQWKTCAITANVWERHTHPNQKIFRRMATLKDLCSSVPKSLLRVQTDYNLNLQKQAAYNKRMERLGMERAIFEQCKHTRTQKRVKNAFSRDEAGRCGDTIVVKRFSNSRLTCVCKSRNMY